MANPRRIQTEARDVPILFSAPMVRAILRGDKTQTRRIVKCELPPMPAMDNIHPKNKAKHPAPYLDAYCGERKTETNPRGAGLDFAWWTRDDRPGALFRPVRWRPGTRLWVREGGYQLWHPDCHDPATGKDEWHCHGWQHAADDAIVGWNGNDPTEYIGDCDKWKKPSIHMPRWASRITLLVEAVRVERLNDISEEDAVAEGIYWSKAMEGWTSGAGPDESCDFHGGRASKAYEKLWDRINGPTGPGAWDANPWVSVTTFRRIPVKEEANG